MRLAADASQYDLNRDRKSRRHAEAEKDAMEERMKQQSIGRLGRAEQVTATVLWQCSPGARSPVRRRLRGVEQAH